jgi:mRNA interferase MazF
VDLGLAAKVRPALALSVPVGDTERALVTLVPHTTSRRGSRLEVPLKVSFLKEGGFDAQGLVTVPFVRGIHARGVTQDACEAKGAAALAIRHPLPRATLVESAIRDSHGHGRARQAARWGNKRHRSLSASSRC